jgi:hypothetical protein
MNTRRKRTLLLAAAGTLTVPIACSSTKVTGFHGGPGPEVAAPVLTPFGDASPGDAGDAALESGDGGDAGADDDAGDGDASPG